LNLITDVPGIMVGIAVAAPTLAPTPAPSNAGDTWVPTSAPTCMPEHVAYAAAHDGLIAWLNRALKGLCHRTLHVSLPSGPVPLGDAGLDPLPPGLRLVLRGSSQPAAGATALNFDMVDPLVISGNDVRVEFSDMSLVNVRCAAHLAVANLGSPCSLAPSCGGNRRCCATVRVRHAGFGRRVHCGWQRLGRVCRLCCGWHDGALLSAQFAHTPAVRAVV
jgi:hypothetical protein